MLGVVLVHLQELLYAAETSHAVLVAGLQR